MMVAGHKGWGVGDKWNCASPTLLIVGAGGTEYFQEIVIVPAKWRSVSITLPFLECSLCTCRP